MPGKDTFLRAIDLRPSGAFDAGADPSGTAALAPPVQATFGAPSNLALTTALERSAGTPTARISATWYPPAGVAPAKYTIQWSTSSSFPDGSTNGQDAAAEASTIGGLKVGTVYYVRVAAIVANVVSDWSATSNITTALDTTPPNPVTSVAWAWGASGDLDITWVDPTSDNLKTVEVKIWSDAAKTTFYRALYAAPGALRTTYTAAMNAADTSNAYDAAIYIEVKALSWGGIYSSVATPASNPSKAVPATPSGLASSWDSDTGIAGGDCVISWTKGADCIAYRLTIDGTARTVYGDRFTYTLDANRAEHSNTPDPVLTISLVALDGLNQSSSAATSTATNAAPATTSATLLGAFSTIGVAITASAAADVRDYTVRIILGGATSATYTSKSLNQVYSATAAGSYQVGIVVNDVFGQSSSETVSSAVVIDALTVAELRSEAIYTDDLANTSGTLAALKDDNKASGGVSYPVPTYRDSTSTASTASSGVSSLQLSIPALTVAGDVMIASFAFRGGSGVSLTTPPSGWTLIGRIDSGSSTSLVTYKRAWQSGDVGPTLVISANQAMAGSVVSVSSCDVSTIVDVSASQANSSSTSVPFASVTTTAGGALLLAIAAGAGGNTFTPDGAMTERQDVKSTNASSNVCMEASTQALGAAGATGTRTATQSGTNVSVAYTIALRPVWHWTQVQRALLDRYISMTISAASGQGYVGVSSDNVTWSWFSGPLLADGHTLTAVASEAAAQAAAISLPLSGATYTRWDLPTVNEGRYVKLGHRPTTSGSYSIWEWYPRRIVEGDDVRAESLTAINIKAASITADRMSVTQLSALAADMGTITAGTITGATIQTATSGARVVLSSATNGGIIGYGSSDTYDPVAGTGTYQILWKKADGKLYAGTGNLIIDTNGASILQSNALDTGRAYRISKSDGTYFGGLGGSYNTGTQHTVILHTGSITGEPSAIELYAQAPSGKLAQIYLQINSGLTNFAAFSASTDNTTNSVVIDALNTSGTITLNSPTTISNGGLAVGGVAIPTAGQIRTSDSVAFGDAVQGNIRMYVKGVDSTSSNYALFANSGAGTNLFWVRNDGAVMIAKSGGTLGFFQSTPVSKPTVTGSRGSNAALASLLTALANYGLVVDSST